MRKIYITIAVAVIGAFIIYFSVDGDPSAEKNLWYYLGWVLFSVPFLFVAYNYIKHIIKKL